MILYLKVKPNQRFDKVEKIVDDWQIRIKAPAMDGKANEYLVEFLGVILDLPKSKIIFKKGMTSRLKCLEILADESTVISKLYNSLEKIT